MENTHSEVHRKKSPLELSRAIFDRIIDRLNSPFCIGKAQLYQRSREVKDWIKRENTGTTLVSGLIALRTNPKTGLREVLLVNGIDSVTGKRKEFSQFIGGKIGLDEDPLTGLTRELREEVGKVPARVKYMGTYVQQNKKFAIHAFVYENCKWKVEDLKKGGDVDTAEWTATPFIHSDRTPRVLTEQTDRYLCKLGFVGPRNKNTPPDDYDGDAIK